LGSETAQKVASSDDLAEGSTASMAVSVMSSSPRGGVDATHDDALALYAGTSASNGTLTASAAARRW